MDGFTRLAGEMLRLALKDATWEFPAGSPVDEPTDYCRRRLERREAARAWLRGGRARFNVYVCCDLLRLDYGVLEDRVRRLLPEAT